MSERNKISLYDRPARTIRFDRYSKFKTLLWFYKSMMF